jgi:hypothetical protein
VACVATKSGGHDGDYAVAYVRFAPKADKIVDRSLSPLCARKRHMHCSKTASLFDHLVGGYEQLVRHGETEHPGGLVIDDQLELVQL